MILKETPDLDKERASVSVLELLLRGMLLVFVLKVAQGAIRLHRPGSAKCRCRCTGTSRLLTLSKLPGLLVLRRKLYLH